MSVLNSKIFKQEINFIAGAAKISQLPKLFLPQIVFVGKSNVGKSSLINAICRRKSLARTSHTPGRTQQINFFSVADKFLIADLPGYGFAKVSQQDRFNWQKLILYYLEHGNRISLVNILVDARRGLKEHDIEVIGLVQSLGHKINLIITKLDKVSIAKLVANPPILDVPASADLYRAIFIEEIRQLLLSHGYEKCNIVLTSARDNIGINELQNAILHSVSSFSDNQS